jgi:hypothetical protein
MTIKQQGGIFGRNPTFNDVSVERLTLEGVANDDQVVISSGAISINSSAISVDTEASASSDDLDTINGGAVGQTLILRASNNSRTVVVKDGTGNIELAGDFSLTQIRDCLFLLCISDSGTYRWIEISRSDNRV